MSENHEPLDRVMVIAAHPDDPEFGCGGTIAKWAAQGKEITFVLLTSGTAGGKGHNIRKEELAKIREAEQRAAADVLGAKQVLFLRHPDGLLENTIALRRELSGIIRHHKPHIVLAIDPWQKYQMHPDHRAAGQAALDAVWAAREWNIFPEQLADGDGPWRTKELYLFWTGDADYYEDVGSAIDKRIAALRCHVSQVGENNEKLDERIRERTAKTAQEARAVSPEMQMEYAEAFKKFEL